MRNKTRNELSKLRELIHFFAGSQVCFFCKEPLLAPAKEVRHGNSTGPQFLDRITIHHIDGDHSNNAQENKAPAHEPCHRSHHRTLANLAKRAPAAETFDEMDARIAAEIRRDEFEEKPLPETHACFMCKEECNCGATGVTDALSHGCHGCRRCVVDGPPSEEDGRYDNYGIRPED